LKKFCTHEELVEILRKRNLKIDNEKSLKENFESIGYYNLINGYSDVFQSNSDVYEKEVTDANILHLYNFDKVLRNIVYKYALIIESKVKSVIGHIFSQYHGINHKDYLERKCFDKDGAKDERIEKLIKILQNKIRAGRYDPDKSRACIVHYIKKHGQIPLWVLFRILTFGEVNKFYSCMTLEEKTHVASAFSVKPANLEVMLKMLVKYRNTVAHDERIYCVQVNRDLLPSGLQIYDEICVMRNRQGVPLVGRNDFLALLIIFKYLLPQAEFDNLWKEFLVAFETLRNKLKPHHFGRVVNKMRLKNNWRNIKGFTDSAKKVKIGY